MIGVCIPAHNEETRIRRCLMSILKAARHPALLGEEVAVVLVVDASRDRTASMGALEGVSQINVCHRNVGRSRGEGAALLIARGAQWLAFTDADSVVPHDWLVRQLSYRADAVCGTVRVIEWGAYGPLADFVRHSFLARYRDVDGHTHVHGANLGVCARRYMEVGGFDALSTGEDHALIHKLKAAEANIVFASKPHVWTSARKRARAPDGFSFALAQLERAAGEEAE